MLSHSGKNNVILALLLLAGFAFQNCGSQNQSTASVSMNEPKKFQDVDALFVVHDQLETQALDLHVDKGLAKAGLETTELDAKLTTNGKIVDLVSDQQELKRLITRLRIELIRPTGGDCQSNHAPVALTIYDPQRTHFMYGAGIGSESPLEIGKRQGCEPYYDLVGTDRSRFFEILNDSIDGNS